MNALVMGKGVIRNDGSPSLSVESMMETHTKQTKFDPIVLTADGVSRNGRSSENRIFGTNEPGEKASPMAKTLNIIAVGQISAVTCATHHSQKIRNQEMCFVESKRMHRFETTKHKEIFAQTCVRFY
jgi:hypothetical protein